MANTRRQFDKLDKNKLSERIKEYPISGKLEMKLGGLADTQSVIDDLLEIAVTHNNHGSGDTVSIEAIENIGRKLTSSAEEDLMADIATIPIFSIEDMLRVLTPFPEEAQFINIAEERAEMVEFVLESIKEKNL